MIDDIEAAPFFVDAESLGFRQGIELADNLQRGDIDDVDYVVEAT